MEDEKVVSTAETDEASQAQDDFASVREHFEAGQELSDEEVDKIADAAVDYLKAILSYFGENGVSIDEYDVICDRVESHEQRQSNLVVDDAEVILML